MKISKSAVTSAILAAGIALFHILPPAQRKGSAIFSRLQIPYSSGDWEGTDISGGPAILARAYTNNQDKHLMFLILDAANFHNPKACFSASGYKIKELDHVKFSSPTEEFRANALYFYKGNAGRLVVYWMCIDGKQVGWMGQKIKELAFSLFKKDRTGVMVRVDIPTNEDNLRDSISLAKNFIASISPHIDPQDAEYIFGKRQSGKE